MPRAVTSSTAIANAPGACRQSRNGVDVNSLAPLSPLSLQTEASVGPRDPATVPSAQRKKRNNVRSGRSPTASRPPIGHRTRRSPCSRRSRPSRRRLTLSEIARRAALPLTTTHRLVGELCASRRARARRRRERTASACDCGRSPRWRRAASRCARPRCRSSRICTRSRTRTSSSGCARATRSSTSSGSPAASAVGVLTRVGGRFPLHASGIGLVLLAHAPEAVQREVLDGPLQRFTDHTITDPEPSAADAGQIRRDGVAVSDRQVTVDALSVAAPIVDARRRGDRGAVDRHQGRRDGGRRGSSPAVRAAALGTSRALSARRAGLSTVGTQLDELHTD